MSARVYSGLSVHITMLCLGQSTQSVKNLETQTVTTSFLYLCTVYHIYLIELRTICICLYIYAAGTIHHLKANELAYR